MERLVGKRRMSFGAHDLVCLAAGCRDVLLDIGTGDGRFVDVMARQRPEMLAIGLDACREPLVERSRRAPANALYLIANALDLPGELDGLASRVTLNFPWGSLLAALLAGDERLMDRLASLTQPDATVEIRINADAAADCGASLQDAVARARRALGLAGFRAVRPRMLAAAELRAFPSTWAHRLAFGRDPRAIALVGRSAAPVHSLPPGGLMMGR